jgi:hypothetical protein
VARLVNDLFGEAARQRGQGNQQGGPAGSEDLVGSADSVASAGRAAKPAAAGEIETRTRTPARPFA